jgi:HJR/Mrr/RecB family endonuclease
VRKVEDAYEKLLFTVARRASDRGIILLASVLYGGIGLALPLAAGWSVPWLVFANISGTTLAGTFLLVWLAVQVQASRRRNLIEWTTDLRRLDAQEFEWLVGEVWRREGWTVDETGRQDRPDGGIDLVLRRRRERVLVQCKRWTAWQVGVDDVRAFAGSLAREGLPTAAGVFVTLSSFTEQAQAEGKKLGLTLVDNVDLYAKVEKVRRPEPCEKCGSPMLLDRSPRGWWFRCISPGCDGKHDLGRNPADAVQLLTQPPD